MQTGLHGAGRYAKTVEAVDDRQSEMKPGGPGGAQACKIISTLPEAMPTIYGGRDDGGTVYYSIDKVDWVKCA
jgi:hypothetical protein